MMLAFQKGSIDWTSVPVGQVAASHSLPQVKSGLWKVGPRRTSPSGTLLQLERPGGGRNAGPPAPAGPGLRVRPAGRQRRVKRRGVPAADHRGRPAGRPGAHGVQDPYPYDPAKAKELLDSIGPVTLRLAYPSAAAGGHRQEPDGELREDRHRRQGERNRLQATCATCSPASPRRTSQAGSPTTRRWTTSSTRCSRATHRRTPTARPTRTPRSTPSSRRLAPRPGRGAAPALRRSRAAHPRGRAGDPLDRLRRRAALQQPGRERPLQLDGLGGPVESLGEVAEERR